MEKSTPAPPGDARKIRQWGMLCHLAGLLFLTRIPFADIIGPLVIWLLKREDHNYIDKQGRESLNFQISMALYAYAITVPVFLLGVMRLPLAAITVGGALIVLHLLLHVSLTIIGAVKANNGCLIRYPFTMRFF